MSNEFKPGMVVRLKSGGPLMTIAVEAKEDESHVHCEWFQLLVDGRWEATAGNFDLAVLDVVTGPAA
jgi:uncharacterized protein YodC (DUF2158 family)